MMIKEWSEELAKRPREEQRKMITTTIKAVAGVLTGLLLAAVSAQAATIELTKDHGTYTTPVNGAVRLPFTLDTGATTRNNNCC